MTRRLILVVVGVILCIAIGVLSAQRLWSGATPPPGRRADTSALTPTVQATLQALPHLHGLPISPDTFHSKVVIVTFFASWCPPCREEFAHLQALHTQYQEEGVTIIAVNLFEDFDQFSDDKRLTAFLDKTKPPFTVLKGNEMISQQFGTITRIPSLFIFDRQGQQAGAFRNEGDDAQTTLDVAALRRLVTTLL